MRLKNRGSFNAEYSSDGVSAMVLFRSKTIGGMMRKMIARCKESGLKAENANL